MNPTVSGPPKIPAARRSSQSPRPAPGARPVPCPYCGTTSGVRQTSDTGRIQAWACDRCDTIWAFTVPDSRTTALLGDLGAAAEEIGRLRWTLRQLCALADDAPTITDRELRTRLLALASDAGEPGSPRLWATARRAQGACPPVADLAPTDCPASEPGDEPTIRPTTSRAGFAEIDEPKIITTPLQVWTV